MGIQDKIKKTFGQVLRRLREESDRTQEQFGFDADLTRNYVSLLETGEQAPSLTTVFKIADALDIPCSELIGQVEAEMKKKRSRSKA